MIEVNFEYDLDRGSYELTSLSIDKSVFLDRIRNTSKQEYIDELKKVKHTLPSEYQQALVDTLEPSNINLKAKL